MFAAKTLSQVVARAAAVHVPAITNFKLLPVCCSYSSSLPLGALCGSRLNTASVLTPRDPKKEATTAEETEEEADDASSSIGDSPASEPEELVYPTGAHMY